MTKTAGSRKGLLAFYILNGGQSKGMEIFCPRSSTVWLAQWK